MVVVGAGMRETLADTLVCILQVVLAYETDKVIHIKDGLIGSIEDNRDHHLVSKDYVK